MIDNERKWRYNNNNKNEMIHERSGESADRRALARDLADCDGKRKCIDSGTDGCAEYFRIHRPARSCRIG